MLLFTFINSYGREKAAGADRNPETGISKVDAARENINLYASGKNNVFNALKEDELLIPGKENENKKNTGKGKDISKLKKIICLALLSKGSSAVNRGHIEN